MADPKTPTHPATAATAAKPTRVPAARKGADLAITRETIAAGLEAFQKAGGKIEVLGTTRYPPQTAPKPKSKSPKAPR